MIDPSSKTEQSIDLFGEPVATQPQLEGPFELYEDLIAGVEQQFPLAEQSDQEKTIKQLELALWGSGQSVWTWDRNSKQIELNFYLDSSFQISHQVMNFDDLALDIHPDDADAFLLDWNNHVAGYSSELRSKFRFAFKSEYYWFEVRGKVSAFDDFGALTIVGTFTNISAKIERTARLSLMSEAFSKSKQPMLILSQNMLVTEYNEAWVEQLDPGEEALNYANFAELVTLSKTDMQQIHEKGFCGKVTELKMGGNAAIPVEILINQFQSDESLALYYIVLVKDLTESIETERRLHELATVDAVTGLANRAELQNRLNLFVKNESQAFDLFYIELIGVKEVSDALGHHSSDTLIANIAKGFVANFSDAKLVSRWGDSDFVLLLDRDYATDKHAAITNTVAHINQTIKNNNTLQQGQQFVVNAFIGVASFPENALSADDLIRRADAALYFSKDASHDNYSIYSEGMAAEILNRINLVNDLREAIAEEKLSFVLQGKYNAKRELIGAELLCRWISETHGFVSPGVFIPLIEKYGMEFQLGILAVKSAIRYLHDLKSLQTAIPISVNIAATQVLDVSFMQILSDLIADTQVDASLIELEVTESVFINDNINANERLNDLKNLGVRISLDDFGTGYSSLSYLGQYQFDVVKIDRSFIIEIEQDEKAHKLFLAIINVCNALNLDVVVEGIETENQFAILHAAGVDKFQGFLLGRPSPFSDFVAQNQLH